MLHSCAVETLTKGDYGKESMQFYPGRTLEFERLILRNKGFSLQKCDLTAFIKLEYP